MASDGLRRILDGTASLAGLILLGPLFFVVAFFIKLDSPGPVFYRARRVGWNGKPFRICKFRSMEANADKKGPGITAAGDNRITRMGRLLRRTKIDELPQLINVLCGEMSLVGPRPEDSRYVALYTPEQRQVLRVRPGITSAASLAYRHEQHLLNDENWEMRYRQEVLPSKLAIELDYLFQRTLCSDIRLILRTISTMLR